MSTQLLDYTALVFVLITSQTSVTITCGIQPAGVVTMVKKVLHNTCDMYICDLPDANAFISGIAIHIKQIPHAH